MGVRQDVSRIFWQWLFALVLLFPAHHAYDVFNADYQEDHLSCVVKKAPGHSDHCMSDHSPCGVEATLDSFKTIKASSRADLAEFVATIAPCRRSDCFEFAYSLAVETRPPWIVGTGPLHARVGLRLYA
jgi:hypothetical protein